MQDAQRTHRLAPDAQSAYQQTFNDPREKGSLVWHLAGRALIAAGVLPPDTPIDRTPEDQKPAVWRGIVAGRNRTL